MAVTDLTNTTWYLNDTLTMFPQGSSIESNLIFVSNGISWIRMCEFDNEVLQFDNPHQAGVIAYSFDNEVWVNEAYRTIQITGGNYVTDQNLIDWFEANGTQLVGSVDISYAGSPIASLSVGETATLNCANKLMSGDVVIVADALSTESVAVTYNGNTIFNQRTGTATLPTTDKVMATNVVVVYS